MDREPVGADRAKLRQDTDEALIAREIIVQHADAGAGANRLDLAHRAGQLDLRAPAAQELGGVVERRCGDQVLDVADEAVAGEVGRLDRRGVGGE